MQVIFHQRLNSGLEPFNFADIVLRVLFYTKVFVSCILDFFLYDVTQPDNNNGALSIITDFANKRVNFSSNRVDDDLF